jgi:hypothetical protein
MMKGLWIGVLLLCVSGMLGAQKVELRAGPAGGTTVYNFTNHTPGADTGWTTLNAVAGAWVDATYARLSIDFEQSLVGYAYTGSSPTMPVNLPDSDLSYVNFTLIGKYPFTLGPLSVWPAAGIRYTVCVTYLEGGANRMTFSTHDLNDFYLMGGGGVDISLGGPYLTLQGLFGYNLTPSLDTGGTTTDTGYDIEVSAGLGFHL